ncbi:MAG TPA: hypothetical protein VMG82_28915 [Candidatus Sulfotelmatobacter sp.]|nr:hypothetical protein [Candidatus Sulfotelmatobacter sp.]
MFKSALSLGTCLFVVAVFDLPGQRAAAQSSPVRIQQPLPGNPGAPVRTPQQHQPPCWQEAGISKAAMEQRGAIQRRTQAEVQAVCAETALTPQQRQEKIRQIREQAKQEMDALVSPQQMEALKSCQMSRNHGGGRTRIGHPSAAGGRGPCGELPSPSGPSPGRPPAPTPGGKPEPEVED